MAKAKKKSKRFRIVVALRNQQERKLLVIPYTDYPATLLARGAYIDHVTERYMGWRYANVINRATGTQHSSWTETNRPTKNDFL